MAISPKMLTLLAPHKIALLALENQSAALAEKDVAKAQGASLQLKAANKIARGVFLVSSRLAYRHAVSEFKLMGLDAPKMPKIDYSYVDKLMKDLRKSLVDRNLSNQVKALRASLAATSAANRAYTLMQLSLYNTVDVSDSKLQKVWIANKSAGTPPCKFCLELHGTTVHIDEAFPIPLGATPYQALDGPPMHPRCRCRLSLHYKGSKP